MEIRRGGSQASTAGTAENFTGRVRLDPLNVAPSPARVQCVAVTFEPGSRTHWHSHPLGQTLVVTAGCGRVGVWGGAVHELRPGYVVWASPAEKHWHGAAPTTALTHIAIHEAHQGRAVEWMEPVDEQQYAIAPAVPRSKD